MAVVPFKLWEDMKRWKEEQIQKPRLPPNPNVSATASLQRDLSSVMANEDYLYVRLFICASWSPAGKGLTSWLSFLVSSVSLSLSHWYPGSGVVLDCIDS